MVDLHGKIPTVCTQWTKFVLITARKRSLGKGNVFTLFCQSFCSRGKGCIPACNWGVYTPWEDTPWADTPPPGQTLSRDGNCSGRYASYWNAFLYYNFLTKFNVFVPLWNPGSVPELNNQTLEIDVKNGCVAQWRCHSMGVRL